MKEVLEQYGGIILAMVVGLGILYLLFSAPYMEQRTMPQTIGEYMCQAQRECLQGTNNAAFTSAKENGKPSIVYRAESPIVCGEVIPVDRNLIAKSKNGERLPLKIIHIEGESCQVYEREQQILWRFDNAGMYTALVRAYDAMGNEQIAQVTIPVNERMATT